MGDWLLSKTQVDEMFRGTKVRFSQYHKYRFYFSNAESRPDYLLTCVDSVEADEIYRYDVGALEPFDSVDKWHQVWVNDKYGKIVFETYDGKISTGIKETKS